MHVASLRRELKKSSLEEKCEREGERKSSAKCISSQAHGDCLLNKCDRTVPNLLFLLIF